MLFFSLFLNSINGCEFKDDEKKKTRDKQINMFFAIEKGLRLPMGNI
jgi:hypothetical protein